MCLPPENVYLHRELKQNSKCTTGSPFFFDVKCLVTNPAHYKQLPLPTSLLKKFWVSVGVIVKRAHSPLSRAHTHIYTTFHEGRKWFANLAQRSSCYGTQWVAGVCNHPPLLFSPPPNSGFTFTRRVLWHSFSSPCAVLHMGMRMMPVDHHYRPLDILKQSGLLWLFVYLSTYFRRYQGKDGKKETGSKISACSRYPTL